MTVSRALLAGVLMLLSALAAAPDRAAAQAPAAPGEDLVIGAWALYASRFVSPEGRVIDDGNGGISHSEGQGYGMLMAVAADDRPSFEKMLGWTTRELMVRDDHLAAWRWEAAAQPHVTDRNNATDGDLLIAWALARAAARWNRPEWREEARTIVDAVLAKAVISSAYGTLLMPGVDGFKEGQQPDGPVVNLSYWIFPALDELAAIAPKLAEARVSETGFRLASEARFGQVGLPADWTSLAGERPEPAKKFPPQFGYNAIRVPLYLAWARTIDPKVLETMANSLAISAGGPAVVDLETGMRVEAMADAGYAAILDVVDCALGRSSAATHAKTFEPTHYYPSTLHLLALIALAERYPACLP